MIIKTFIGRRADYKSLCIKNWVYQISRQNMAKNEIYVGRISSLSIYYCTANFFEATLTSCVCKIINLEAKIRNQKAFDEFFVQFLLMQITIY